MEGSGKGKEGGKADGKFGWKEAGKGSRDRRKGEEIGSIYFSVFVHTAR